MLRHLRFALVALWFTPAVFAQGAPSARLPIIDMHLHAYPSPAFSEPNPNPVTGKDPGITDEATHMRATMDAMRHFNIVKGFVSGPIAVVHRWHDVDPDRIVAGPYFEGTADLPFPDLGVLRTEFTTGKLGVLGEIGAQYSGTAADDPKLEPYFALAEELDIPVGIHTGLGPPGIAYTPGRSHFRVSIGSPIHLEEVLVRHPKLRLYIMHAGWPYLEDTKAIMRAYPQVYADLAIIDWNLPREEFHDALHSLVRAGLGKRLMFGTDQIFWPEAIGMAIDGIESANFLTPEQKRDIFYNNAARFLRMTN
jgi:uncharacterized protein